jgi:hypothetical protein
MRLTVLTGTLLGLALAAGCTSTADRQPGNAAPAGSPSASASPLPSQSGVASPSAMASPTKTGAVQASERCHTRQLRAEVDLIFPAGEAGSEQDAMLGLTNNGAACTMYGYVGMRLLDANGQARPTKVIRSDNGGKNPPRRFTLQHGQTAWSHIGWTFQPNPDEEATEPLCGGRISRAQVTPPDESERLTVGTEFGTICSHGTIFVLPMSLTRPQP